MILQGLLMAKEEKRLQRLLDAEYAPRRRKLRAAGLDEKALRRMPPDERVAALEQARLDPYEYIYLAC